MSEEKITMLIIAWLQEKGWRIIAFDYPQSGLGTYLHPDNSTSKNAGSIVPDIVAINDNDTVCVFFEDKDHFYMGDFEKQNTLIHNNNYTNDIHELLNNNNAGNVRNIYYGIGYPTIAHDKKGHNYETMVDFVVGVDPDQKVTVLYSNSNIFC